MPVSLPAGPLRGGDLPEHLRGERGLHHGLPVLCPRRLGTAGGAGRGGIDPSGAGKGPAGGPEKRLHHVGSSPGRHRPAGKWHFRQGLREPGAAKELRPYPEAGGMPGDTAGGGGAAGDSFGRRPQRAG